MYDVGALLRDETFLEELEDSLDLHRPPPLLRCAKIKITSRCNLRCVMCKYWQTRSEQTLSSERWREVFGELHGLGCQKLHFSGGEVFLRRDFLDLVESAVGAGMKVNMTTNGTLIDREKARRIGRIGVNSVSISLDGARPAVHDAIRGRPDAFRKSVRTIRWLKRSSCASPRRRVGSEPRRRAPGLRWPACSVPFSCAPSSEASGSTWHW